MGFPRMPLCYLYSEACNVSGVSLETRVIAAVDCGRSCSRVACSRQWRTERETDAPRLKLDVAFTFCIKYIFMVPLLFFQQA